MPRKITPVSIRKTVHSCWCEGKNLHVIFTDHTELIVEWGWEHAELKAVKGLPALPVAPILDGPVSAILAGKIVDYCFLDDKDELVIRTQCGHEAVIGHDEHPVIRRMDVKLTLDPVSIFGSAG